MTTHQFHALDEMEKVSAIVQYGRLVARGTESGYRVFLYRIDNFYVKTCYANTNDQLVEISCHAQNAPEWLASRKHQRSIDPAEREDDTPEI